MRIGHPASITACLAALLLPAAAFAGDLTVSWPAADDDLTAGYRVYIGTSTGEYTRVEDAGEKNRLTIRDLADNEIHYLAVKAYDAEGRESDDFSPELACLPGPRLDDVDPPELKPGRTNIVSLRGANFDADMQARLADTRLRVREVVFGGSEEMLLLIDADDADRTGPQEPLRIEPSSFTLLSSCRKSDEFFDAHPEAIDLDDSGWVDAGDRRIIEVAFGSKRGEDGYLAAADVDGDGTVDGRDLTRVLLREGTEARWAPEPQAGAAASDPGAGQGGE